MRNKITSILLITLLMVSCKSGDSGTDGGGGTPEVKFDLLKSQTITAGGGVIEATDLSISVAPNAASSSVTLDLYTSQQTLDAPSSVTKLYKISGSTAINLSYLKVKYTGTLSGINYIVWQEENYIPSAGKVSGSMVMIPARDSSGYLVAKLSDIAPEMGKRGLYSAETGSGFFHGITGQTNINSSGGHFKVYFPTSNSADGQNIANYLESAYSKLEGYGFNFIGRDWPANVYLQKFDGWYNKMFFDNDAYGYYVTTTKNMLYLGFRTNNCSMYFNLNRMGNAEDMQATAGHEFFHAIQDLYDLRSPVSKKWGAAAQGWLDEACATWFEEQMVANPAGYVPSIFDGNELTFTNGMHVTGDKVQSHGYGMSSMVKYIVRKKGGSALEGIYRKISLGSHPVEAVFSAMNGSGYNMDWYNDYLKDLVTGNIYGVLSSKFGNVDNSRKYESKLITDTLCNFSAISYPDISGQLYLVTLSYSDMANKQVSVNFKTNSTSSKVQLFKYSTSNTFLKSGSTNGELTLSPQDVKTALAGAAQLKILALVTNGDYSSNFLGSKSISMQVKINYAAGPIITLQPSFWEGGVNESKMFSLTVTNPPARVRYDWAWGDGNTESTTAPNAVHAYSSAGIYNISVNLVDLDLGTVAATATGTAKVSDNPAYITPTNSEGLINTAYTWTVVTDYTLSNARYEWDFGDGSAKVNVYNNKAANHSYSSTGTYNIKVDIYDNATSVKIESATTPFKAAEVSALLASIKNSRSITMNASPLVFSNGTENKSLILVDLSCDITWTGINTFTGVRDYEFAGSHYNTTISGTVSMDGTSVTFDWFDQDYGLGEYSWYFSKKQIKVQNMPMTSSSDWDSYARYDINGSDFQGYYEYSESTGSHAAKKYPIPQSSSIRFKFIR